VSERASSERRKIKYSPLNTNHSPLTTHHPPLTTHHSPLTTHHPPLTTHHSPLNPRFVNYYKIQYAQLCINENPGCEFIATNLDAVTHLTDAQEWAGNGSMVGAIKGCTGKEPIVVGKPGPLMIDYLCEKYDMPRGEICMVGDRLDTDIMFGLNNGLKTILVLSGVTTEEKLLSNDNKIAPDSYCDSIVDFFKE